MRKSRTRTFVTVIGVALSAAMITAVATFAVSLQNYMINSSVVKSGSWHAAFLDVDESFIQEQASKENVADTAGVENIGYAVLEGGQNPDKPYLFIAGFSEDTFENLPVKVISGRLPQNSSEVLIPAHVASNGGIKYAVGDEMALSVGSRLEGDRILGQHDPYISGNDQGIEPESFVPQTERTYTVVGICQRPAFEEYSSPGYTLITVADTANQINSYHKQSFSVYVTLTNPWQIRSYVKNTEGFNRYILNDDVLRFMGLSEDKVFNTLLYSVGIMLVALIMTGSVFMIYNSFSISLNERTRQFGILSSVGATEKQLRNTVLFEGVCIGALGIPFGIVVGIQSIGLVIKLIAGNFENILSTDVPLTLVVSVPAFAGAAVVSMITILISAYLPARRAASRPVMESIRQTNEIKIASADLRTSELSRHIYGLEGVLAQKNFKRNKKRYRSIVLSLTLSVVLFVSASAFGTHLKEAAARMVVDSDYDICFTTSDMEEEELFRLYAELKHAGSVYSSSCQAVAAYSCSVKASSLSDTYRQSAGIENPDENVDLPMDIQFVEDDVFLEFIKKLGLPAEDYTGRDAGMIAVAKAKTTADQKGPSSLYDIFTDPDMELTIDPVNEEGLPLGQERPVRVKFVDTIPVDLIPRDSSKRNSETNISVFMVVAPYQLKERFVPAEAQADLGMTFLSDNPSQSVKDMELIIQGAGITSEYTLYNVHEIFEQSRNSVFVIDVFTYIFVAMISLIAVANVFNTISTNIMLRRRELAMLRSVGMADGDFSKMMNFECIFFGIRTLLIGIPLAGICSWLIYKGLEAAGTEVPFMFPWSGLIISVLGVFFIVFITMLYAVRKIKKENIIDALRDDIT